MNNIDLLNLHPYNTPTLYPIDQACAIVEELNSDADDDWYYYLQPNPQQTHAAITVNDDDDVFLGYL